MQEVLFFAVVRGKTMKEEFRYRRTEQTKGGASAIINQKL